jgi:hypothetical protein
MVHWYTAGNSFSLVSSFWYKTLLPLRSFSRSMTLLCIPARMNRSFGLVLSCWELELLDGDDGIIARSQGKAYGPRRNNP